MAALAVVCWRNKATGDQGKGDHSMPRERGERLVENLNRLHPGFEHWLEPAEKEGTCTQAGSSAPK